MADTKTTTVNLITDMYLDFKSRAVRDGFTLQKLTNRSMWMYLHDPEFRSNIRSATVLATTGSNF